ncbi:MAG: hypothetical protein HVN34_05310 [Methanobacteriaceae archaeon]|jgi:hypothetical protein|nr:hypothetical protein [Methanobacteriaceae archaeon]
MLQLIQLKEEKKEINSKDNISFTLIFKDDKLIDQTLPLLKKCIENYRLYNQTKLESKVTTTLEKGKYIKLCVIYPSSALNVSNQEIEDDLEGYKKDFENYYQKLVGKVELIPVYRT